MSTLTHTDLLVLDYLRSAAVNGTARVTYRTVATGAGCARSTAHTALARLQEAGLVTVSLGGTGLVVTLVDGEVSR